MEENAIIRLQDVSVSFDRRVVLRDIDFTIDNGDFVAITGPNGGGKTTLLRVILKLLKPSSGKVVYFNEGKPAKRLRIGYLPQKNMIDVRFPITVGETVRSGMLHGFFGRHHNDRNFKDSVEITGLTDLLDRPIGDLSGGQLQRTLLARAIVSNPDVIVLDEPLSYVDKQFEHQIYRILEDLRQTKTVIIVSHDMTVISGMANRNLTVDEKSVLNSCF